LGFGGTYRDLVGGAREVTNVALGRRQMVNAVHTLAARTQQTHLASSGDAKQRRQQQQRQAKDALVVLLLMVHETTRFLDVAAVIAGLMRPDAATKSGRITRNSTDQDLGWRYFSCLLLSADSGAWGSSMYMPPAHYDKKLVVRAAATVGILLFVEVGGSTGIKAKKALRLFRGNLCGRGRDGSGADVTFLVSGESIAAHRYILAGKSAVFLRQFIGHKTPPHVEVNDMDAATFKAMIHFIYTDTVPEFDEQRRPEEEEALTMMAYHLLEAANRYSVDRLKLVCKQRLQSGAIYVDMAARTLALAEEHNYGRLKAKWRVSWRRDII
ncbi:hypothetical protein BAE44_0020174, partial [Dichanthelium oligosanthes]